MCCACQLGKHTRRTTGATVTRLRPSRAVIKDGDLKPGDCVSVDQYFSAVPGRRHDTFGKESLNMRYTGGTLFVDHASGYIFLKNQTSLRTGETLVTKRLFEQFAANHGVTIKQIRADNHPFGSKEFREDCLMKNQDVDYSGVGAHHQNSVAERALRTVMSWARASMLHALIHWPDQFSADLWPMAVEHVVFLYNHMPHPHHGHAPVELFTGTKLSSYATLQQARVWGCPVYVLEPRLQDGKKIPKWNPRSRRGQFVGFSPEHAGNVGRVLNLITGAITPQFHVVYDEHFTTVENPGVDLDEFSPEVWTRLVTSGLEKTIEPEDIPPDGSPTAFQDWFDIFARTNASAIRARLDPEGEERVEQIESSPLSSSDEGVLADEGEPPAAGRTRSGLRFRGSYASHQAPSLPRQKIHAALLESAFVHGLDWNRPLREFRSMDSRRLMAHLESLVDPVFGTLEDTHPLMLKARANGDDSPTFEEATNGPEREQFWAAMRLELQTLESMNVWDEVDRQPWMHVLPSVWAFRRKRLPTGEVKKHKARFCVAGNFAVANVDYFDTWCPLVNWTTVRLLLILSVILDLATLQVDYTVAFVHAPIDLPPGYDKMSPEEKARVGTFVEMPRGFTKKGKVLRLNKSLYGLPQSPRNFFLHLKSQLESIGFESKHDVDPCLFVSDKVICLVYCDDTLLYAKAKADI